MAEYIVIDSVKAKQFRLGCWLVHEGQYVTCGQQIVSVRADDDLHILHAPLTGILIAKHKNNGETFARGEKLGKIITAREAGDIRVKGKLTRQERRILESLHAVPNQERSPGERRAVHMKASPGARAFAREHGLAIEEIPGTGPDGRVQLADVKAQLKRQQRPQPTKIPVSAPQVKITPLARALAKSAGIALSALKPEPGQYKIKKKDVERAIREQKRWDAQPLLAERVIGLLTQTEAPPIRLSTTEACADTNTNPIELTGAAQKNFPKRECVPALEEKERPPIRLSTTEACADTNTVPIELSGETQKNFPKRGPVPTLEEKECPPIRLSTTEACADTNTVPIELSGETQKNFPKRGPVPALEEKERPPIRLSTTEACADTNTVPIELTGETQKNFPKREPVPALEAKERPPIRLYTEKECADTNMNPIELGVRHTNVHLCAQADLAALCAQNDGTYSTEIVNRSVQACVRQAFSSVLKAAVWISPEQTAVFAGDAAEATIAVVDATAFNLTDASGLAGEAYPVVLTLLSVGARARFDGRELCSTPVLSLALDVRDAGIGAFEAARLLCALIKGIEHPTQEKP